jgi:hypothetical protein
MSETESAALTHDILVKVATFLRALPAEQYAALVSGEAKLAVLPAGSKVTGPGTAKKTAAPAALPVPADRLVADLAALTSRADAVRYLDDLRLKGRPPLVAVAEQLGIKVMSKHTIATLKQMIIDHAVGYRLDADAIAGAR